MASSKFDEAELVKTLERLPSKAKLVFATACAQRLLPAYAAFVTRKRQGDPEVLGSMLARLWEGVSSNPMSDREAREKLDLCMNLVPVEDERDWIKEQDYADDAIAATAYALRCRLEGKAQDAAWAARRAFEAVDGYVMAAERTDLNSSEGMTRALNHPLVQAELTHQRRDLEELSGLDDEDLPRVIRELRDRSKTGEMKFFDG